MSIKICHTCGTEKDLNEFYEHPQCKDGHIGICKTCKADYYRTNKEKKAEYQRQYWHKNRERGREYRSKNAEYIRARARVYLKAYNHIHRLENTAMKQRRKARKVSLPDSFTASDWRAALNYFDNCCAICGRPRGLWHTIAADHWIPLTSPDCPGTVPTNIVPLCHGVDGCNNSKMNTDPIQWLNKIFGTHKARQILKRIDAYFEWVQSQH